MANRNYAWVVIVEKPNRGYAVRGAFKDKAAALAAVESLRSWEGDEQKFHIYDCPLGQLLPRVIPWVPGSS